MALFPLVSSEHHEQEIHGVQEHTSVELQHGLGLCFCNRYHVINLVLFASFMSLFTYFILVVSSSLCARTLCVTTRITY
jgi:hypothetical protein